MNNHILDDLGPFGLMLLTFAVLYLVLQFRNKGRQLQHSERMAALEKGVPLPPDPPSGKMLGPKAYLLRGLIWLSIGLGIVMFLVTMRFVEHDNHFLAIAMLGLIPIGIGVAHLAIYRLDINASGDVKQVTRGSNF